MLNASAHALSSVEELPRLRGTPAVLQSLMSIDQEKGLLTLNLELGSRHRRIANIDWLLRLDLAAVPITHEQWHGRAHSVGGQLTLEVQPKHWPQDQQRWFLRLWLRDPEGTADWDLVETRPLP